MVSPARKSSPILRRSRLVLTLSGRMPRTPRATMPAPRRRSSARSRHRGLRQKTSRLCQSYSRRFTTSRPTPMAVSSSGPCAVTTPTIRWTYGSGTSQRPVGLARQLMDKGANSLEGIEFDYSQKDAKYDGLRGDAVRDALRKASSYVNRLGIKLGRVLEIATEPAAPVSAGMSPRMLGAGPREAAAAAIPVEPGVQTLRTEVQVTWELAQ